MQTAEQTRTIDPETGEVMPAALALVPQAGMVVATKSRAILMREHIAAEGEIRALIGEYVKRHMVDGTDFGTIPGTPKPTLLKPGAEKLVDLLNVEPVYEVVSRVEDWDRGLFHYELRCKLVERGSGQSRAEGMGSANSREGRYRWRNGERVCPNCGKPTIIKGKAEFGGGWLCFAKKGGCGAKFGDDAPEIATQVVGKVENDDVYTLVNTILKMAKKRALVDGAIALARCSDIFTQDLEDIDPSHGESHAQSKRGPAQEPRAQATRGRSQSREKAGSKVQEPDVPRFSRLSKWELGEQWGGKPLADAPLDALLMYASAVQHAINDPANAKAVDQIKAHMLRVEAAIASKEPRTENEPAAVEDDHLRDNDFTDRYDGADQ